MTEDSPKDTNWEDRISEQIAKAKERSIHMSDVHKETKTRFMNLAKEHFGNNYGDALTFLMGMVSIVPDEELVAKIDLLADEINRINSKLEGLNKQPEKVLKTASGKIIGGMKNVDKQRES